MLFLEFKTEFKASFFHVNYLKMCSSTHYKTDYCLSIGCQVLVYAFPCLFTLITKLKIKYLWILFFTFCTSRMKMIFYNFSTHFQNNLRYKLGPFVQYLAVFLCQIFYNLAFNMPHVLSGAIVSFLKMSIKLINSALEIISLVTVIGIVHLAKEKTWNKFSYLVVMTKNFSAFIEV